MVMFASARSSKLCKRPSVHFDADNLRTQKLRCLLIAGSWLVVIFMSRMNVLGLATHEPSLTWPHQHGLSVPALTPNGRRFASHRRCKDLGGGWHVPVKKSSTASGNACSSVPIPTTRVDNGDFSICVRTQRNMMDSIVTNHGYSPECKEVIDLLATASKGVAMKESPPCPPGAKEARGLLVDVGANIGACTVWAAARGYDVIAFEPNPIHASMLKASAALRPDIGQRIALHEIGLSHEAVARAVIVSGSSISGNSRVFKTRQQATLFVQSINDKPGAAISKDSISLSRLDDYCTQTIDVLNLAVQGHEGHVLSGARNLMRRGAIKHIRFHFWPFALRKHGSDPVGVLTMLSQEGYALFLGDKALSPDEFEVLVDVLCADDTKKGCLDGHVDLTAVWQLRTS